MRKRGSVLTDALMVLELKGLKTQKTEEAKTMTAVEQSVRWMQ